MITKNLCRIYLIVLIPAFIVTTGQSQPQATALQIKATPLRDGFVMAGIDGQVVKTDDNDEWFIKFDKTIVDDRGQITAGRPVQLLPSSTLEKITDAGSAAGVKKGSGYDIRLWGRITRYGYENFIFPTYFLPVTEDLSERPATPTPAKPDIKAGPFEPNINEPGDAIILPEEVLKKLKPRRLVRLAELKVALKSQEDAILVERTGFITKPKNSPYPVFRLDALGRNMEDISFRLLPCEAIERLGIKQNSQVISRRYKITGILTKYKGQYYLLPQRATRAYSHGNFAQ